MSRTTRRRFLQLGGSAAAAVALGRMAGAAPDTKKKMNVLLLYVDDLRLQLGCYGVDWIHTPNIDKLARQGVLFENAYSQYPICGPSRASMLTGLRPTPELFWKWNARVDVEKPDTVTLPELARRSGYATQCVGKVFHDIDDCESVWSEGAYIPPYVLGGSRNAYVTPEYRETVAGGGRGPAFERADVEADAYGDGMIADRACQDLRQLAAGERPFFHATGFLRPHLPFCAPSAYWDLYDRDALPMVPNPEPPANAPAQSVHNFQELRNYAGIPDEGPMDPELERTLVHGYCASVSYVDAQIGRVLDEVDRLGLQDNTLVVLLTDHGWQLGEHSIWTKHCLFEESLHCPLLFRRPGLPGGQRATGLAEYVDVYPTLCDLMDLPAPAHLQGRSLRAQLENPAAPGSEAVFSRIGNADSIKTATHRYSQWRGKDGRLEARMLYDHQRDPNENENIAEQADAQPVVQELAGRLDAYLASLSA